MLVPLPKRERRMEDNVLPLINIVFLLLIFFMVAGIIRPKAPFAIEPPVTEHASAASKQPMVLAIAADGRLALAGETVPRERLTARLEALDIQGPLRIKADTAFSAVEFSELLPEIRAAGVAEVRLLTTPDG